MTNRDYLRGLSNEKLAELLKGSKICSLMEWCPNYDDCGKCIKEWLDAKREIDVEKGQIRETDSRKWLVVDVSTNHDNCLILSETGAIRYIPTDIVDTWKIVTDETEEVFCNRINNRITHDFYNKISNILKEINKKI